jgi:hypothetical protein
MRSFKKTGIDRHRRAVVQKNLRKKGLTTFWCSCIIVKYRISQISSTIALVSLTCDIPPISQNQPDCRYIEIITIKGESAISCLKNA